MNLECYVLGLPPGRFQKEGKLEQSGVLSAVVLGPQKDSDGLHSRYRLHLTAGRRHPRMEQRHLLSWLCLAPCDPGASVSPLLSRPRAELGLIASVAFSGPGGLCLFLNLVLVACRG